MKQLVLRLFLFTTLPFISISASYGQVKAAFTAGPLNGCAPLVVAFLDRSTGGPVNWKWDLGNGTLSSFQNPSTTYTIPGTYSISLVISNAQGKDSISRRGYITVYETPKPDFRASDTTGCFPLLISFTNSTSVPGIPPATLTWKWDFGDGDTSFLQQPVHTYNNAGSFTVNLQVTTGNGCSQTAGKTKYIRMLPPPKANFTGIAGRNCQPPVYVQFANSSGSQGAGGTGGPGVLTYHWDFGDGTSSSLTDPVHVYTSKGSYSVTLMAVSGPGCSDTLERTDLFNIGREKAHFVSPDSICTGMPILINNTSSPAPLTVLWDFGDRTGSVVPSPVKTYSAAGTYLIRLTDTFPNCIDSVSRPIRINPRPSVSFSANSQSANSLYSCSIPFTVNFTSNAVQGINCHWDFGDGQTGTDPNPVHLYTVFGNFTVRLIMTGNNGCPDTLTKPDYIRIRSLQINIPWLPAKGCLPLTVAVSANLVSPPGSTGPLDKISVYRWDFGDGTGSALPTLPKTYLTEGDFTVKLVVTTAGGCVDSVVFAHGVQASQKPRVNFSADPRDGCRSVPVRFTNLSIPSGDQWQWYFGDGIISPLVDPAHLYTDTGYFKVSLVTWNKGCADTLSIDRFVHINLPVAGFTTTTDCKDKYTRTFKSISIGALGLLWDFGDGIRLPADGSSGTTTNPTHRYLQKGVYRVNLLVSHEQCVDSASQTLTVADEHPGFQAGTTTVCRGEQVKFSLSKIDPVYMAKAWMDFGDGIRVSVNVGSFAGTTVGYMSHVFAKAGRYSVSLIHTDVNGCTDSVVMPRYIQVNGPSAAFNAPQAVCIRGLLSFSDHSVPDSNHVIVQWTWNFGDGTIQNYTAPPFTHIYAGGGRYTVGLRVTDAAGCADSLVKKDMVLVSSPRAAFAASDTNTCPGATVRLSDSSSGGGLLFQWSFGNGNGSVLRSPQYAYPSPGNFVVKLLVRDTLGCRDSLIRIIRVTIPVAVFDLSDSMENCPPLQARFTNHSLNYITLQWDFGDGAFSSLENPVHFYNYPGEYLAKALIRGPGGCVDSGLKKIVVRGPKGSFHYSPTIGCRPVTVRLNASIQKGESLIWDFNDGHTDATPDTAEVYRYQQAGGFLPRMILIDSAGCKVVYTGADSLKIIGVSIQAGIDTGRICDSGFVRFTDHSTANDGITRQVWNFGDGTTAGSAAPGHFYDSAGLFTVRHWITTVYGCTDSVSWKDTVKVYRSPVVLITGDSAACVPGPLIFRALSLTDSPSGNSSGNSSGNANVADSLRWLWDTGNGKPGGMADSILETYPSPGNYLVQLQATNSHNCSSKTFRKVTIWPLPNTFAGNDTFICQGHPIQLNASGAESFIWETAPAASCIRCADPLIDPTADTNYVVTGVSLHGCEKKDSVYVRVRHPFRLTVSPSATICTGQTDLLKASGADQFQWTPATGLSNPDLGITRASPAQTTMYTVTGRDSDHCFSDSSTVFITVSQFPTIIMSKDTTVITGSVLHLHPDYSADIIKWDWSPATGLSCTDCPAPNATIKNTVTYNLSAGNAGGCSTSTSLTIHALCNGKNFFVPNTFSPNGDGMNDIFYVRGKGLNSIQSIRIYDRWGQIVFEKRDFPPNTPSYGWDGMYKGEKAPMDVYLYVIGIICDNSEVIPYHGNVALVR
ncbi:PKD domain-containing protein [Flavitalea flava]